MESDIFDIIEESLTRAGYQVLDGDRNSIILRHPNSDNEYIVNVKEMEE